MTAKYLVINLVVMLKEKGTNGPFITLAGYLTALIAFVVGTVLEDPSLANNEELNNLGSALFIVAIVFMGILVFLIGVIKSLLFYSVLQPAQRKLFICTIMFALASLVISIKVSNNRNQPAEYTNQELYCSQQYGKSTTPEGVKAYQDCIDSTD